MSTATSHEESKSIQLPEPEFIDVGEGEPPTDEPSEEITVDDLDSVVEIPWE